VETDHVALLSNIIGIDTAQNPGSSLGIGINVDNSQAVAIGGRSAEGRNIISGNVYGVSMQSGKFVNMNANYIGTDITGSFAIPNAYGIYATANNLNIEIGGDSLFESNLISGNTFAGIYGEFANSAIQGNYIGVDRTGNTPLGNGTYGIFLGAGSNSNLIGGALTYQPNLIANNGNEALYFEDNSCDKNSVIRNVTYCNSLTAGQGGFVFNGGNNGIAPPQILIANENGVTGLAPAGYQVDIYVDDTCSFCEGHTLLGSLYADDNGTFELLADNISGNVTAVMTDLQGNSSEYSPCVAAASDTCLIVDFILPVGELCGGTSIQLFDATLTKPGTDITDWHWDFGDGGTSSQKNPDHLYTLGGEYLITLSVTNSEGCVDSASKTIQIQLVPVPAFAYSLPACVGQLVEFTDQSFVSEGDSIIAWHWNFGDGGATSQQNPGHTYDQSGDYPVELKVTGLFCEVSITQQVQVAAPPVALFSNPETACIGGSVLFEDQSTVEGDDEITSWLWEFGDGSTSEVQNPEYEYTQSGLFNITLTVTTSSGCSASQTGIIFILNQPEASFEFDQAGLSVSFTNTSTDNGAASYLWDFGDGFTSTEANPVHDYSSGGVYEVCLTVFDSACATADTICNVVDLPTGVDEGAMSSLTIYPNPANYLAVIEGIPAEAEKIAVINAMGQNVFSIASHPFSGKFELDLAGMSPGLYHVMIYAEGVPKATRRLQVVR
jgi:PKD repeat protein